MRTTVAALLALGACTTMTDERPGGTPIAIEADSIRYETGPCYGTCPVYAVALTPDGRGTFEGKAHTAVTGLREFTTTPAQYARLAAALQPFRPATGTVRYSHGEPNCRNAPTDMPSAEVTWTRAIGDSQSLYFYYGCGGENPALADAMRNAPSLLPIGEFIGRRD